VRICSFMSRSVPKCPDPFPNIYISSKMSGSVPKLPDPFLKVDSRMNKINKKVEQIQLGNSGSAQDHNLDLHSFKSF
jgi:hypothetical protein